ncbi:tripartite tricarboxylate transporter TctB family protein [Pontitalea aquivivens]|uniref:tripartite tricarboxylate transporter TctB family protein n=1 Tax=Pontitalea aquivivens TaxID=3388663 RepID=UPI0039705AF7
MRVNARQDLIGGICVAAVGLAASVHAATSYNIGTPGNMGPGFFPLSLGLCLLGLGSAIAIFGSRSERVSISIDLGAFAAILASMAGFALVLPLFGLLPASVLLVFVALTASRPNTLLAGVLTAAGVSTIAIAVFIVGLGVQLPILRWPL